MADVYPAGITTPLIGRSLVAAQTVASLEIATSPTVAIWPTIIAGISDVDYDPATGIFTFGSAGFFICTVAWNIQSSGQNIFWTDIELSTDGGTTWTRGSNSANKIQVNNTSPQTIERSFSRPFLPKNKLRCVRWAESAGGAIVTESNTGSTAPAGRITATYLIGARV